MQNSATKPNNNVLFVITDEETLMKIIVAGTFENRLPGISGTSYPRHHHLDFSCQAWQILAGACREASPTHKAANRGLRSTPPREKWSSSSGGKALV